MKSAVVFSVSIFNSSKAWMIDRWLEVLETTFADADVFVGINPDTCNEVYNKILSSKHQNLVVSVVPRELYCESDASGTQAALKAMRMRTKEPYKNVWFAHTKGGVNDRQDRFEYYLNEFLSKRTEIEALLDRNPSIGVYGHYGVGQSADGHTQWKTLDHLEFDHGEMPIVQNIPFDELKYTHVNWSYVETFYVIKGSVVSWFLKKAPDSYFKTRIKNRWYGEVVFPWLSSRFGLYPYVKHGVSHFSPVDLNITTKEWEKENGLHFDILT
jgi:hypothetical protein